MCGCLDLHAVSLPSLSTPTHTTHHVAHSTQHEENKLDGFLKEVAETEVPSDAPQPPPEDQDQSDGNEDEHMLPSQRGKSGQSGLTSSEASLHMYACVNVVFVTCTGASADSCLDCTPDELAALVREIRDSSGLIGPHTYRLVSYKNTFVGSQLVDWLIKTKGVKSKSRETAPI